MKRGLPILIRLAFKSMNAKKYLLIILVGIMLVTLVSALNDSMGNVTINESESIINNTPVPIENSSEISNSLSKSKRSSGGGATIPISIIDLTEQGTDYSMKPGRLKFEFEEQLYAIQVRRVKQDYVWFLVMDLDENKLEDITAYTIEDSFNLTIGEKKEIDLDRNGIKDVIIELDDIVSIGKYNSVRSSDFSIKKINTKEIKSNSTNENVEEIGDLETILTDEKIGGNEDNDRKMEGEVEEPVLKSVIALDQELLEQPTFLDNIINWFKELFF